MRDRDRRRAGEGLHHDPLAGARTRRRADHGPGTPEADRRRAARGPAPGGAGDHLGDGHAAGGRAAGACRRHGRPDRRLPGHQPGRLQGPPRARSASSTPSRRWCTWARSRPWPQQLDLELLEVVAEPYAVARVLGSEQVQQAGRPLHRHRRRDDGRGPGPPRRHRGDAHVRPGWPRLHQVHRRPAGYCPSRGPRRSSWTTPAALAVRPARRSGPDRRRRRGHLGRRRGAGTGGAGGGRPAAGPGLPVRRRLAPAGDRRDPARARRSGSVCRSAGRRRSW